MSMRYLIFCMFFVPLCSMIRLPESLSYEGSDEEISRFTFVEAIEKGDADTCRVLLAEENLSQERLTELLCIAIRQKCTEVCRAFIEAGAPVNEKDSKGDIPLLLAGELDKIDIVRVLLEAGALVDNAQDNGATLLYQAAGWGDIDICRLCIEYRADVNVALRVGTVCALASAAGEGRVEVCRLLLDNGALLGQVDDDGNKVLDYAAYNGHEEVCRLLLARKAFSESAIELARERGYVGVCRLLRKYLDQISGER